MAKKGLIFAIEEMSVHDGPGLRTTVFFKGCPMRCQWCHNPESWEMRPQRVKNPNGCIDCGACRTPCEERCIGCGRCLPSCPRGLLRVSGTWWEPDALARHIRINEPFLLDGGVTISGGEALMQPEFLIALLDALSPLHRAIETSGYGRAEDWRAALERLNLVYYDVKIVDPQKHLRYTGVRNERILHNLDILIKSQVPFVVRIPTITGVNDDRQNIEATCQLLTGAKSLIGVELLPYNSYAGAKYPLIGLEYARSFQTPSQESLVQVLEIFKQARIAVTIR